MSLSVFDSLPERSTKGDITYTKQLQRQRRREGIQNKEIDKGRQGMYKQTHWQRQTEVLQNRLIHTERQRVCKTETPTETDTGCTKQTHRQRQTQSIQNRHIDKDRQRFYKTDTSTDQDTGCTKQTHRQRQTERVRAEIKAEALCMQRPELTIITGGGRGGRGGGCNWVAQERMTYPRWEPTVERSSFLGTNAVSVSEPVSRRMTSVVEHVRHWNKTKLPWDLAQVRMDRSCTHWTPSQSK